MTSNILDASCIIWWDIHGPNIEKEKYKINLSNF